MNKVLSLLAVVLAGLTVMTGSAAAATGFVATGAFAQAFPEGRPAHQHRIAVNETSGDVYVTDVIGDQIAVYRPNGTAANALTSLASSSSPSSAPTEQQPWPSSAAGCSRMPKQPRPQMHSQLDSAKPRSRRQTVPSCAVASTSSGPPVTNGRSTGRPASPRRTPNSREPGR